MNWLDSRWKGQRW